MQTQNLIDQFLKENEAKNIRVGNIGTFTRSKEEPRATRNRKNLHGTFQPIDEYRTKKI